MTEIASESVPNKPAKRAYHRKPVPPPPPAPPSPPSPAVIALENEIVKAGRRQIKRQFRDRGGYAGSK